MRAEFVRASTLGPMPNYFATMLVEALVQSGRARLAPDDMADASDPPVVALRLAKLHDDRLVALKAMVAARP